MFIRNWLRNRIALEFLGIWESIYIPNFNFVEFDGFRKSAGLHTFTLSVTEWYEKTNAIGIYSKRGKYDGTAAIKNYILLDNDFYKNKEWLKYAEEANILNIILFHTTAKKLRELNPKLATNSNVRDYATINELTVLSNLESHNAEKIELLNERSSD